MVLSQSGHLSGYWKYALLCAIPMIRCGVILYKTEKMLIKKKKPVLDYFYIEKIKTKKEKDGDFIKKVHIFYYLKGEKICAIKVDTNYITEIKSDLIKPILIKITFNKTSSWIEYLLTFGWLEDTKYYLFKRDDKKI